MIDAGNELEGMVTMNPVHPLTVSAEGNRLLVIPGDNVVGVTEITSRRLSAQYPRREAW